MRLRSAEWLCVLVVALMGWACAANQHVQLADTLVSRGRYTEAMELYRKALEEDSQDVDLQEKLARAKRLESQRLMGMASVRSSDRDFERAFELYADATRYDPANQAARDGLQRARDLWIELALSLEQQGQMNEALEIHERILREYRDHPPSRTAIARIQDKRADEHRRTAASYLERGMPGNALVEYLEAQRLKPNDPTIEDEISSTLQALRRSGTFLVRIFAGRGSRFSPRLWAIYLTGTFENSRYPIVVESGREAGGYLRIELNGRLGTVSTRKARVRASIQVPDGFTTRPNPTFGELKARVDEAYATAKALEPPVHEAETKLEAMVRDRMRRGSGTASKEEEAQRKRLAEVTRPYREAMEKYQKLSAQLVRLPESFQEPAFKEVSYFVREVTRSIKISGRAVVRGPDAAIVKQVSFADVLSVTDQAHPLLKANRDRPEIPPDPLELPDSRRLQLQAEASAMSRLEKEIEALFSEYVTVQWRRARHLAVDGQVEEAVETFLRAYMTDPSQPLEEAVRYVLDVKRGMGLPLAEVLQSLPTDQQASSNPYP